MKQITITILDDGNPNIKVRLTVFDLGDTATDREDNVANSITEAVFKIPEVRSIRDLMPGRIGAPANNEVFKQPDLQLGEPTIEERGEASFWQKVVAFCKQFKG